MGVWVEEDGNNLSETDALPTICRQQDGKITDNFRQYRYNGIQPSR